MGFSLLILIVFLQYSSLSPLKSSDISINFAKNYLNDFGYYGPNAQHKADGISAAHLDDDGHLRVALRKFQKFAGIKITGVLDNATKSFMAKKRCGVRDVAALQNNERIYKWRKLEITWSIVEFTTDLPQDTVRRTLREALAVWQRFIPLVFMEEWPLSSNADIQIRFTSMYHGDKQPFDGPGNVLAHAMFPPDGRVHFDDAEKWTSRGGGTDLLWVAVHEIGHVLGLFHSSDPSSVMAPFYHHSPSYLFPQLSPDDIYRMQKLYGTRKTILPSTVTSSERPVTVLFGDSTNHNQPSHFICPKTIDAATLAMNNMSYLFSGEVVWEMEARKLRIGRPISSVFVNGPNRVTAVVTNHRSQLTLLLQDRTVYGYLWSDVTAKFHLHRDYPKSLDPSVPFVPTAAFQWKDGNILLISPHKFATFDENWNTATMVNDLSAYFENLPKNLDAVITSRVANELLLFADDKVFSYDMERQRIQIDQTTRLDRFLLGVPFCRS